MYNTFKTYILYNHARPHPTQEAVCVCVCVCLCVCVCVCVSDFLQTSEYFLFHKHSLF